MAIAIELMLKAFIFSKNPILVFKDLPLELRVAFTSPESIGEDFKWRQFDVSLRSFEYKTMEMYELISIFYVFRPDLRQELQPFFKLFAQCRNVSLHASLPSFQKYELERTAYLAMRLLKEILTEKIFGYKVYGMAKDIDTIMSSLNAERANKVKQKIEQAKKASKSLEHGRTYVSVDSWESYVTECPVCGSEGILSGDTDVDYGQSEEDITLNFLAGSFQCDDCKLELVDIKEMKLAGMSIVYERNSELEKWMDGQRDYEPF